MCISYSTVSTLLHMLTAHETKRGRDGRELLAIRHESPNLPLPLIALRYYQEWKQRISHYSPDRKVFQKPSFLSQKTEKPNGIRRLAVDRYAFVSKV